ncbi:hypothetical protein G6F70_004300 [Rhizopus microsporus]|nr:hypothetical protein G6F71_004292 [Rhizopus microsporus]KAG1200153.1 hypothetical protein G6F70_004300 [Rhizopus microsporus]KAG1211818.1 hypothetical protein G6F69_004266 [Rhizopus microsporus]KAG1229006.1 hypothetical protein G6F67_007453 [Rhizopus microsporus]KAG1261086.1 hypothetical protein G6F68_006951 [Rhizopus microsporus]
MAAKKLLQRAYFVSNLFPERNVPAVRVGVDLVEIDNDAYDICRGNVSSKIMSAAADNTKTQFSLDGTLG